jgi:hypothetical protein
LTPFRNRACKCPLSANKRYYRGSRRSLSSTGYMTNVRKLGGRNPSNGTLGPATDCQLGLGGDKVGDFWLAFQIEAGNRVLHNAVRFCNPLMLAQVLDPRFD